MDDYPPSGDRFTGRVHCVVLDTSHPDPAARCDVIERNQRRPNQPNVTI
jgi:hypothetical protein